jgi:hypothetical protein
MSQTDVITVVQRLLDDDYVHARLAEAGAGARDAYQRARRLPARKAVQDKTLYDRVRQTAAGATAAARRALGEPEPEPPRGRRARVALVLLATGGVVVWASRQHGDTAGSAGAAAGAA